MPYQGEIASKSSHSDIVKNPEIQQFLAECDYLTPPSDEECLAVASRFDEPPNIDDVDLPSFTIAIDGSHYEASIDERLPSTKLGYIKVGAVLINLEEFGALRVGRYVDPFKVAAIQNQNSALTFSLPSANIRWGGKGNVRDSFRAYLDQQFYGEKTRFDASAPRTSLRTTLFHLASHRPGEMGTNDTEHLKIHRCPTCGGGPVVVEDVPDQQFCPYCGAEVYPTDCLRLWEEVNDFQSNQSAISRLMLALEHIIPMHYIRFLLRESPIVLARTSFFVDGPLAVFGNAAWLHRSIMIFLDEVNSRLTRRGYEPLLIIGLQKTGQVVDHLNLIERFIPLNRLFAIEDEYRYKYILAGREEAANGFGYETYYGQDFIYRTPSGRSFVFAIPYPFASKDLPEADFRHVKTEWHLYPQLARAVKLIDHFESDLYENAVVPIALAHRYTAISLSPGGRVLDLLTKDALGR